MFALCMQGCCCWLLGVLMAGCLGHAMRMALDLGLHRALEKLADDSGKQRTEEEERDLGTPPSTYCADPAEFS